MRADICLFSKMLSASAAVSDAIPLVKSVHSASTTDTTANTTTNPTTTTATSSSSDKDVTQVALKKDVKSSFSPVTASTCFLQDKSVLEYLEKW